MTDQKDTRKKLGSLFRDIGDAVLPKGHAEDVKTFGSFLGRTILGTAAYLLADVVEVVQCSVCREDATQRKPEGNGEFLYACAQHGGGDGWEAFRQEKANPLRGGESSPENTK